MAIIIASATGGFWSATTAWASGVVPTLADDVILSATSGNMTVSDSRNCLTLNASAYTNTLTINNGVTLTVYGTAITLGSGMTYATGTTGVLSTRGNQAAITINFNNKIIPRLTIGRTTGGQDQRVNISGTTPTIQNLVISNGATNAGTTLSGAAITIISSLTSVQGTLTNVTGQIRFSGDCTIASSASNATISGGFIVGNGSSLQMVGNVYLQSGTVTFSGTSTLSAGTNTLFCPGVITFNTSGVTWYDVALQAAGQTYPLSSALNISNNLINNPSASGIALSGGFPVNVSGSYLNTLGNGVNMLGSPLNMLGTGTIEMTGTIINSTININTTNISGYTFGSATRPTTSLNNTTLILSGTSVAQVYSTTGHTLSLQTGILSTNNTATGANIIGGSQIIWGNISLLSNQPNTLTYDTIALGNLTSASGSINTGRLYVGGNLSVTTVIGGTSTIELNGSVNKTWGTGSYQNSIFVNKTSGATITAGAAITWGLANRILTMNSPVIFSATTFTTQGTPLTIGNSSASSFNNLTIANGTNLTITGGTIPVTNNLTLNGTVTFSGTSGWNCANLLCSTNGSIITLQTGNTYNTTNSVNMLGITGSRISMVSSSASNRAVWTLAPIATQSMVYVNATRIDSSLGQTVWSFGPPVLTDTLNWNSGSKPRPVAWTFVN